MATDVITSASAHHPEPTGNTAIAERVGLLLAVRESTYPLRGAVGHLRRCQEKKKSLLLKAVRCEWLFIPKQTWQLSALRWIFASGNTQYRRGKNLGWSQTSGVKMNLSILFPLGFHSLVLGWVIWGWFMQLSWITLLEYSPRDQSPQISHNIYWALEEDHFESYIKELDKSCPWQLFSVHPITVLLKLNSCLHWFCVSETGKWCLTERVQK